MVPPIADSWSTNLAARSCSVYNYKSVKITWNNNKVIFIPYKFCQKLRWKMIFERALAGS